MSHNGNQLLHFFTRALSRRGFMCLQALSVLIMMCAVRRVYMTEGMPHSELLRRALEWIMAERGIHPHKPLRALLDEAGMRFNLTPNDDLALHNLLKDLGK